MSKKINKEEKKRRVVVITYDDLPSPMSYVECVDYDGMGNQGRVFTKKNK